MEGTAEKVRKMAHNLYEVQPLEWKRYDSENIGRNAESGHHWHRNKCIMPWQYQYQSVSWCSRSKEIKRKTKYRTLKRGLTTKIHLVCTSARYAFVFSLSAGNRHDAPQGRKLLSEIYSEDKHYLLMDRAYEDDKTRFLAVENGFIPIVPPKKNRKEPWDYDKELYKQRNEEERYFLRLKRFRKVFTRYDKLDTTYISVIHLAMIFDAILMWTRSNLITRKSIF